MPSKIHFENSHKLKAAQLAEGSQPLTNPICPHPICSFA